MQTRRKKMSEDAVVDFQSTVHKNVSINIWRHLSIDKEIIYFLDQLLFF
jgi:hypothetical protein